MFGVVGAGFSWGELIIGGAALLISVVFGWPAWRLAQASRHSDEMRATARAVAEYLGLPEPLPPGEVPPPSPEHPSFMDLLTEIRDATQEQAALTTAFAYHLSDDHGGKIPAWLVVRPAAPVWRPPRPGGS